MINLWKVPETLGALTLTLPLSSMGSTILQHKEMWEESEALSLSLLPSPRVGGSYRIECWVRQHHPLGIEVGEMRGERSQDLETKKQHFF